MLILPRLRRYRAFSRNGSITLFRGLCMPRWLIAIGRFRLRRLLPRKVIAIIGGDRRRDGRLRIRLGRLFLRAGR